MHTQEIIIGTYRNYEFAKDHYSYGLSVHYSSLGVTVTYSPTKEVSTDNIKVKTYNKEEVCEIEAKGTTN